MGIRFIRHLSFEIRHLVISFRKLTNQRDVSPFNQQMKNAK
jgi:hypothetical protein